VHSSSQNKLLIEILGFFFYLYELYVFLYYPQYYSIQDWSFAIYSFRFALVLIVLPLLYLYRVAAFFGLEPGLTQILTRSSRLQHNNTNKYAHLQNQLPRSKLTRYDCLRESVE